MKGRKRVDLVHIALVKEKSILYEGSNKRRNIKTAEDVIHLASSFFVDADRELFYVIALNASMEPVNISLAFMGGTAECKIYIPEIFKTAILSNASHIICMHNHPSGNSNPSQEDKMTTLRIQFAGKMLGISLQDHIILGEENTYYSFQEAGVLQEGEWILEQEEIATKEDLTS